MLCYKLIKWILSNVFISLYYSIKIKINGGNTMFKGYKRGKNGYITVKDQKNILKK